MNFIKHACKKKGKNMPLFLKFTPTKNIVSDKIVHELCEAILKMPSLIHQGTNITLSRNTQNCITLVDMEINGLAVVERESEKMLCSLITERLKDSELPFYLSSSFCTLPLPTEGIFSHERFKPLRSKNARLLAKLSDLVVPEELCCKLSGDIMDDPVFDIRSPNICYDQDFLQYWLRKSEKKLMPHLNIPCDDYFLQINFDLKIKIINFVKDVLAAAQLDLKQKTFIKFKLSDKDDKKILNQALRRAAMSGDSNDIAALLSFGADVNSQDDTPQKRNTALHWAIKENKISNAIRLVRSGGKIDIPDANGVTAFNLMVNRLAAHDQEIQPLILNCDLLGLPLPNINRRSIPQENRVSHGQNSAILLPLPSLQQYEHNATQLSGNQNPMFR
ncbi:MAG: hypothetical protein NTU49_06855 [Gammaproteobacteria bacterium]|nr:hypothetical protein [Gammaproteobacteria bacterium]